MKQNNLKYCICEQQQQHFICQNGRKPERETAHKSWLLTQETRIKHKH